MLRGPCGLSPGDGGFHPNAEQSENVRAAGIGRVRAAANGHAAFLGPPPRRDISHGLHRVAEFNRATTAAALQLDVPFDLWRKRKRAGKVTIGDVVEVVEEAEEGVVVASARHAPRSYGRAV